MTPVRRFNFLAPLLLLATSCNPSTPSSGLLATPAANHSTTTPAPANQRIIGMNLGGIADWSGEWPFADSFKTSRKWMEQGPGPFTYDDRGYPLLRGGQTVETLIFRDLGGHYPAGDYVVTYSGSGTVEVKQYDVDNVVSSQPGRIVSHVTPANGGVLIRVTSSPARDPVRDISAWVPGLENSKSTFPPQFLERLKPFGVIRFMDWQHTNNSPLFTWSQRPKIEDARWSTDLGVPLEIMIDLANPLGADPWFCIPHQADNDFVRNFAKLVKDRLSPKRTVYVEYSNEVWNWGFGQTKYADEQGKKLKLGAADHLRFYARRSLEVFDLFVDEFGSERLVRVLSGQFANPRDCEFLLSYQDAHKKADAFAVGAYFGYEHGDPKKTAATMKLSPDELLDRCASEIDGTHRELIRRHSALARRFNLKLLAYEGGQHLVGHGGAENTESLTNHFIAANRHPRMAELYRNQLGHWLAEGGGAFIAFNFGSQPSKWGSWGCLEYQDQAIEQAPKYRALVEFAREAGRR